MSAGQASGDAPREAQVGDVDAPESDALDAEPTNTHLAQSDRPPRPRDLREEAERRDREDPTREPLASWASLRGFLANLMFYWRTSLPFRTITISVALTSATVLAVGLIMSNSIANDLYSSRLTEVLAESDRAATQAQATFDSGVETDVVALETLRSQALDAATTAAPNADGYALYRADQADGANVLQNIVSVGIDPDIISDDLRGQVATEQGTQFYQSTTTSNESGEATPAIIVGTLVEVPTAGMYELYFVYSLEEAQRTLDFIQRTLLVSMLVLVLLIGVITGFVMRAVVQPIRLAAQTSRKLAAGQLQERIPESGEDDIATLARSFNDMADSLQEQIERLGHLSQVQQRFVSDVSHELRTPLTTIRLAGQMLYDGRDEFDPLATRSVELLHNQIERFELLLSDLLEISRFDAGAVELLRERNSLATLADEVIGSMAQVALDHGTPLVLVAPGGHGESEFDRRRISRVIRNLIGNAIEHGDGKPIVIRVDSNESAVAISIRDYGVGMNAQQLERSFDRFWRADPSRKRTMGGSGLGLAISNEDALLHDGRLEVWSELGKGANFRLTLPRHVGGEIVMSPLQLEPVDAGETEPVLEAPPRGHEETFADEGVDTQPLTLPKAESGDLSTETIDLPAMAEEDLPTVSGDEPPHEHLAPWAESAEVVEVVVVESPDEADDESAAGVDGDGDVEADVGGATYGPSETDSGAYDRFADTEQIPVQQRRRPTDAEADSDEPRTDAEGSQDDDTTERGQKE